MRFRETEGITFLTTKLSRAACDGANGVILCQAGRFGGWSLHMKDGKPSFVYNWIGRERYTVRSPQALPAGNATVKYDFAYDGGRGAGQ